MSAEATLCSQLPRDAQKTLYSVLSRVALPSEADEKYRTLKLDNAALQQRLLRHDGALELLALCRCELRGRTLVLPADASADAIHRALDAITAAAREPWMAGILQHIIDARCFEDAVANMLRAREKARAQAARLGRGPGLPAHHRRDGRRLVAERDGLPRSVL